MCFSATASFTAAAVVGATGVFAVCSARRPALWLPAAIPLIFAAHQFAEGVHWLSLTGQAPSAWARPAMYGFLAFGEVVWPFWVPMTVLALESDTRRKRLLRALLALGIVTAAVRAFGLLVWPVSASIVQSHIQYRLDHPLIVRLPSDVAYVILVVGPLIMASNPLLRRLGLVVLASLVVAKFFFFATFISVWCFFGALISALLVVVVRQRNTEPALAAPVAVG